MLAPLPQPETHARNAVASILHSPKLTEMWKLHHFSRQDDNPALKLAQDMHDASVTFESNPELVTFMREMVRIEITSLGKQQENESSEKNELRTYFQNLEDYLISLPYHGYHVKGLSKDYQEILHIMETQTGQWNLRPLSGTWSATKHIAGEFWEQTKAHPIGMSIAAGFAYYMITMSGALSGKAYVSPYATSITGISMEDVINGIAPTYNPALVNLDYQSCHSHFKILTFGNEELAKRLSDGVANVIGKDTLMQHCTFVDRRLHDLDVAASSYNQFLDDINTRYDYIVLKPVTDLMGRLTQGDFYATFTHAATVTNDFLKVANKYENAILHPFVVGSACFVTYTLGTMKKEDFQSAWHAVKDFGYRSYNDLKLHYLLCASASTAALAANGWNYHPMAVWMGFGGLGVAHIVKNIMRRHHAPSLIQDTALSVTKAETIFANPERILAGLNSEVDKPSGWRKYCKPKPIAAIAAMAMAFDLAFNNGQGTAAVLGGTTVTVPFLLINIPEDLTAHGGFGFVGSVLGFSAAFGRNMFERGVKWTSKRSGNGLDDPEPK